jgi:hypothetical protein
MVWTSGSSGIERPPKPVDGENLALFLTYSSSFGKGAFADWS